MTPLQSCCSCTLKWTRESVSEKLEQLTFLHQFCDFNYLVNIKWNGKVVENVEASQGEEVAALKRVIEETCGVPSKKQKLLFKGKFLKVSC